MEVEQVVPITTGAHGINGGNVVIVEEKGQPSIDRAAASNRDAMASNGDGAAISRSASCQERRQAKKRGSFGLFRAVFMSFGGGSMKKRDATGEQQKGTGDKQLAAAVAASDAATWKDLVDGMRPLRLHGYLEYYPPPPPRGHDVYHDVLLPPASPERPEGMTSRYASAQDLQQLDGGHEEEAAAAEAAEEEEKEICDPAPDGRCPNAIDMQAEEFIARFYAQFRLQKSDSFNNRAE